MDEEYAETIVVVENPAAGFTINLADWRQWERLEIAPTLVGESVMILRSVQGVRGKPIPIRGGITVNLSEWKEWAAVEFRGAATVHITLSRGPEPSGHRVN